MFDSSLSVQILALSRGPQKACFHFDCQYMFLACWTMLANKKKLRAILNGHSGSRTCWTVTTMDAVTEFERRAYILGARSQGDTVACDQHRSGHQKAWRQEAFVIMCRPALLGATGWNNTCEGSRKHVEVARKGANTNTDGHGRQWVKIRRFKGTVRGAACTVTCRKTAERELSTTTNTANAEGWSGTDSQGKCKLGVVRCQPWSAPTLRRQLK